MQYYDEKRVSLCCSAILSSAKWLCTEPSEEDLQVSSGDAHHNAVDLGSNAIDMTVHARRSGEELCNLVSSVFLAEGIIHAFLNVRVKLLV